MCLFFFFYHFLPSTGRVSFRYIQAATSPKDVVIVVDVSGSMKGLRLTIAKHTINTILDTLGENDFVNIIAVSAQSPPPPILKINTLTHKSDTDQLMRRHSRGTGPHTHSRPRISFCFSGFQLCAAQ